jgi:hypothetical protein
MMICLIGWRSVRRAHVTGHSLVLIGLLSAMAAKVIGALALTGDFAWPTSDTHEIDRLNSWLDARWPWLEYWSPGGATGSWPVAQQYRRPEISCRATGTSVGASSDSTKQQVGGGHGAAERALDVAAGVRVTRW